MKILQVNKLYYPWLGGVEVIVQQISEGLNHKQGIDIEVLVCSASRGRRQVDEINGVRVHRAGGFGIFWGMPVSFDFFRLFRVLRNQYDIIAFHHPFPLADLALLFFKPQKLIVHYHSDIIRQKGLEFFFRPLLLHTLKMADKIVVSNPNLINSSPYLRNFKSKCRVVPFGVDLSRFEKDESSAVEKLKDRYGNFVLFVGRLNYYKGLQYLIEAMRGVGANLVMVGEGPEKKNLELRIKNQGLKNNVFLLPHQKQRHLINFYKACQVFVLPSIFRSEAFGIVLIEAMACGKPVISTELGTGTSWVNQDGQTGLVVAPRDSRALKLAIEKLLQNKELAQKMGQQAKQRVKEKFVLKTMLSQIANIYQNV